MASVKRDPNQFDYQVAEMYENGARFADLERELGVTHKMLRLSVLRTGMKLRPKQGNYGSRNGSWKGGRTVDKSGYILVQVPDHPEANSGGYVREHRLVMGNHIGRILSEQEVVHHKNSDRSDNRVENLELYSKNSEHLAHELKGRCPQWTEDGRQRILQGVEKAAQLKRNLRSKAESCAVQ